ncbi:MAG TPA: type I glutamate--ammonia ligase, partial [Candidatus Tumulicola sp.]|nr:type I glutamate--ammonia ligase [Candidatus Tumulicola sp.]
MTTAADVLTLIKDKEVKFVDLRFTDTRGKEQHVSVPAKAFDADKFESGHAFDGSSIAGWKGIQASDMLLLPDPATANLDPFMDDTTLLLTCDVIEPSDGKGYERDPRSLAKRAEAYLKSTGLGDIAYFGPEPEFFIFDSVRFDTTQQSSYHFIESNEGNWNSGKENAIKGGLNLGYKVKNKEGYFPVPPTDSLQDIRTEMVLEMERVGIRVEKQHHEVATAGQAEIDMRFDSMTKMGDKMMVFKYIIKNVAAQHGYVATFMPKPLFQDNGSGMHVRQSLWKDGQNLFADAEGYAGLSEMAVHYIGGLLKHAPALLAICAPTTNSYRRLVPGYEAPINLVYSKRNRSACIRIPMYSTNPKTKRVEFRPPDPSANPYLAFAAMLMAGIDGILTKAEPGEPLDKDIYDLSPEEMKNVPSMPGSLEEALDCLEEDHAYMLKGDVFTEELIETYI